MQYEYSTPTFITHDSLSQFQHGIICLIICWLHQETLVSHNKKHVENGTKWLGTSSLRTAHVKQPHPSHISFHNQFVHESTHLASCICGILLYSLMLCCMRDGVTETYVKPTEFVDTFSPGEPSTILPAVVNHSWNQSLYISSNLHLTSLT